jgi:flagellar hook assembly protein FlgD
LLNYPNPFADFTEFCFEISQPANVNLKIFTVAGRLIRSLEEGWTPVGYNRLFWDGSDQDSDPLANGVYIYKMTVTNEEKSVQSINKLTVMR